MKSKNSENKENESINALTYEQALNILISTKWQHKRGAAMDKPLYKVYHWVDKTKTSFLKRFKAYIKLPNTNTPVTKLFSTDDGEAKAWRFVFEVIDAFNNNTSITAVVNAEMTFNDFVEDYKQIYISQLRQNKKNLQIINSRLTKITETFGIYQLRNITVAEIEKHRFNRRRIVSSNTVNKEIALLSAFLTGATKQGMLSDNPCHKVKPLEISKQINRQPIYNVADLFKIIWTDKHLRDYCLLLYYTGLRCEDIINLKAENIKEKSGIKYFEVIEGKTNKTVIIPIHQSIYDNAVIVEGAEYILNYDRSRFSAVGELGRAFKEILKENKLNTETTPYWFRHTFQDSLEASGVEEGTIRHLMGKSLSGSMNYYSHANLERMKSAIDKLQTITFFSLFSHQAVFEGKIEDCVEG